jgi:hypothetical protein
VGACCYARHADVELKSVSDAERTSTSTSERWWGARDVLTPIFIRLGEVVSGRAAPELLSDMLLVTPQMLRKRLALPRNKNRRMAALQNIEAVFTNALVDAGLSEAEAGSRARGLPSGLLEGAMYQLGYFSDELHPHGLAELRRLDEVDARISQFFDDRDIEGLGAWLGSSSGPDERLYKPVIAAGVLPWPSGDAALPVDYIGAQLANVGTHMLLSFLAVMDHEIKPVLCTPDWDGYSLIATLLAPPERSSARRSVDSPIARLVDLTAASAMSDAKARLPELRPTPSEVAKWIAGRGRGGEAFDQRLHRWRTEDAKLTGGAFKALVHAMRLESAGPIQTVEAKARMAFPLLVAAHLLSILMPRFEGRRHHDRRGWREAYLEWWEFHAVARGVPHKSVGTAGPPAWLTFDQSSCSLQPSGRSS